MQSHIDRKHMIEFVPEATVAEFLYREDIMDKK